MEGLSLYQTTPPENLPKKPADSDESVRRRIAELGKSDVYYLAKVILGYTKLIPRVHLPMTRFLQDVRCNRRMMLMPRTHYKTTLWTIVHAIWKIINNPNVTILIVADTSRNAERFLQEISQHFQYNEFFRWLYSDIIPSNFNKARWSKTEIQVIRTRIVREPTVDAIGAQAGIESNHYDVIIADDLVTEKHIRSEVEMEKLTAWVGGLESLLVSEVEGEINWVGSRKRKGDTYEELQKRYSEGAKPVEIGPYATQMGDLALFTREVREEGQLIFPEQVSERFLQRLRKHDPIRYWAQYRNSPKGEGLTMFEKEWLRYFSFDPESGGIECWHDGRLLHSTDIREPEKIVLFDPAVAEQGISSKNAIAVLAKGSHPFRFILEMYVGRYLIDEAIQLLFELNEKWKPSFISVEKRGFQGSIKYWLNDRCRYLNLPYLPIREWPDEGSHKAQWAKTEHIRGLQPLFREGLIWSLPEFHEFEEQYEFYPNVTRAVGDDALDVLSQGLDYWPAMMGDSEVAEQASVEYAMLTKTFGGRELPFSKRNWDEAEFLRTFDPTGYGQLIQ